MARRVGGGGGGSGGGGEAAPGGPAAAPGVPPTLVATAGQRRYGAHHNARRSVCIIYTGGTMGMMHDPVTNSLRPEPRYLSAQVKELPELRTKDMPEYEIIEYEPLLDSASMTPDGAARAGDN